MSAGLPAEKADCCVHILSIDDHFPCAALSCRSLMHGVMGTARTTGTLVLNVSSIPLVTTEAATEMTFCESTEESSVPVATTDSFRAAISCFSRLASIVLN